MIRPPGVTSLGRGTTALRGGSYRDPASRQFRLTVDIDMLDLPTLPERMAATLEAALVHRLGDVADRVIAAAQASLVPGHGYDTGLLHDTLVRRIAEEAGGVFYDLLSEEAAYWKWVEFGHHLRNGGWWEGYHYLEDAVLANEAAIRSAIVEAYRDTVVALAGQARVGGALGRVLS